MVTKWGTVFVASGDKTQNALLNEIISLCQKNIIHNSLVMHHVGDKTHKLFLKFLIMSGKM